MNIFKSGEPLKRLEALLPAIEEDSETPLHLGWRLLLTLLLLALLVFLSMTADSATGEAATDGIRNAQGNRDPLVLAFYYTWFDENTWTYDKVPDLPAEQYVSRDRGVMGRHIDQAKQAGIDALLVAWYGPNGASNQTEPNLAAMLGEAAARNFKIGILFETTSPFINGIDDASNALRHALNTHAGQPAFLRVDGRPVVFFWRPQRWGVETWRSIRDQVDPNHTSIWIAEGVDTSYLAVFDGHYLYSNIWNPPSDLSYTNQKFARQVQDARQTYGGYKYWVATVMPGYDDTHTGRGNAFARAREGGAYYERSWQAAIDSQPDWIVITSFNEWPEGTYIEPSVAYGDQYLRLSAAWSQRFKAGAPPLQTLAVQSVAESAAVAEVPVATPTPTPTPLPEPNEPTAYVRVFLLNLRSGPSTDDEILGQMPQDTALAITGRHPDWPDWWQVTHNGTIGWVYAPLVYAAGPLENVPIVDVPGRNEERMWANVDLLKERTPGIDLLP